MYSEQLTTSEVTTVVALGGVTLVLWLLKDTPLGFLWRTYKIFWIVLFATLLLNKFKGDIKEWWDKD